MAECGSASGDPASDVWETAMSAGVELWLVRHGETEWSLSGKHTSRTDIPLTDRGRERAEELRHYFAGRSFDAVLTSPMMRARETCEIAGYGNGALIEEGLREWDYGVYEGRTTQEIRVGEPGWSVWKDPIKDGETVEHVGERADGVIARVLELAAGKEHGRVVLFAHAHILRILAARWIELDARCGGLFALGTGSLSVLGWERETRVMQSWNRGFEEKN